jgi:hypothetical protein
MIVDALKGSREPDYLKAEQARTLESPRLRYGLLARLLFLTMDVFYGRKRSLSKFKVLEVVARVPYQAWEHVAYVAVTHTYQWPDFAKRVFEFVREARAQQDNEQWHLLILEEMVQKRAVREGIFRHRVMPQLIAFFYYHVSWFLYVIKPAWSYALNADFEDHAEHEYMEFVRENPEFERSRCDTAFEAEYGRFRNLADLFRRIALDERLHKLESQGRIERARFS